MASQPRPAPVHALTRRTTFWLAPILLVALATRLAGLTSRPPGLHQDEAANAWNAYCLLKTGRDQSGAGWPWFYFRALGEFRTPLFLYLLVPFQALGGLNVWTTRLPNAVGGVACVALLYYVAARWFGRPTGLVAAALLTLCPWGIQQSRWGHEGGAVLLLTLIPLAAWIWAGLPLFDARDRVPCWSRALLAGLLTGICCYGYPALRLFLPVFFTLAVSATLPAWLALRRERRGQAALAAVIVGGAVTFGPLLVRHLTDEHIGKRARVSWIWKETDPLGTKIGKAAARYPGHFGPDFLFLRGDRHPVTLIAWGGPLAWYTAPLLLLGLAAVVPRVRASPAARLLLVWLFVYPAGDLLSAHALPGADGPRELGLHCMRSMPGLGALLLLAAVGATWTAGRLWRCSRPTCLAAVTLLGLSVLGLTGRYLFALFVEYPRSAHIYRLFHADLIAACDWLRPRLDDVDSVFSTADGFNQPYVVSLVGLRYDPARWHAEAQRIVHGAEWDRCLGYGKIHFLYDDVWKERLAQLQSGAEAHHAIFLVRPGRARLENAAFVARRPDGTPVLIGYALTLGGPQ